MQWRKWTADNNAITNQHRDHQKTGSGGGGNSNSDGSGDDSDKGGVGGDTKGPKLIAARPVAKVWATANVEVRTEQNEQAPIKMVSGRAWSPGIYRALRLPGKTLDVAWERAFICSLTFN